MSFPPLPCSSLSLFHHLSHILQCCFLSPWRHGSRPPRLLCCSPNFPWRLRIPSPSELVSTPKSLFTCSPSWNLFHLTFFFFFFFSGLLSLRYITPTITSHPEIKACVCAPPTNPPPTQTWSLEGQAGLCPAGFKEAEVAADAGDPTKRPLSSPVVSLSFSLCSRRNKKEGERLHRFESGSVCF